MPTSIHDFERTPGGRLAFVEDWRDDSAIAFGAWQWRHAAHVDEPGCYPSMRTISQARRPTPQEPWEALPTALSGLRDAIVSSRAVLDLPEGWDEDGAKPIGEEVWRRAAAFLANYAVRVWNRSRCVLDAPDITPSVDGGVDLDWEKPVYRLLISIPPNVGMLASFFGDNRRGGSIKGEFDPDSFNEGLIEWLTSA